MTFHPDWILPDWPVPDCVRAVCTTRVGGVSVAPFDTFNLGDHVGDAPDAVRRNRAILTRAIGHEPRIVQQVHGSFALRLGVDTSLHAPLSADATWTDEPGVVCAMLVADCLPVLLATADGSHVAAVHAGWRGLAAGVVENSLRYFNAPAHTSRAQAAINIIAWIGPCIGPKAFEVGSEVRAAFLHQSAAAAAFFEPVVGRPGTDRRWMADLAGLCRQRLQAAGVSSIHGNDSAAAWCTHGNPSRFFSHRRDAVRLGSSGRFAACVWIDG